MHGLRVRFGPLRLALLILVGEMVLGGWWLWQPVQYEALAIEAPHDVMTAGLPVYAQFVFRQRVELVEPARLVAVRLPLARVLGSNEMVEVALEHDGRVLTRWTGQSVPVGIHDVEFLVPEPVVVKGLLDVAIAAPSTTHEEQELAIRVFIEQADYHYPAGNFRIAQQEKRGDIGLTLVAEQSRARALRQAWRQQPGEVSARFFVVIALAFLVAGAPYLFWRGQRRGSSHQT